MKIIITIQIIIINIYINFFVHNWLTQEGDLDRWELLALFQAKHGSNAVLDKGGRIPSSPQMSSFPQHSRTQWMNALLFTAATKALKNLCIENYFQHSRLVILLNVYLKKQWHDVEQKIFITIKARADAEHMESLLLFDSLKEVTTCNLLKIFLVHGTMINLRVCLGQYQDWWWWLHPARLKAQAHCSCSDPCVTCPE